MPWFILPCGLNPIVETNYILVGSQPVCPGSGKICAINAGNGPGNYPILTMALKDEMVVALNSGEDSANVLLKSC